MQLTGRVLRRVLQQSGIDEFVDGLAQSEIKVVEYEGWVPKRIELHGPLFIKADLLKHKVGVDIPASVDFAAGGQISSIVLSLPSWVRRSLLRCLQSPFGSAQESPADAASDLAVAGDEPSRLFGLLRRLWPITPPQPLQLADMPASDEDERVLVEIIGGDLRLRTYSNVELEEMRTSAGSEALRALLAKSRTDRENWRSKLLTATTAPSAGPRKIPTTAAAAPPSAAEVSFTERATTPSAAVASAPTPLPMELPLSKEISRLADRINENLCVQCRDVNFLLVNEAGYKARLAASEFDIVACRRSVRERSDELWFGQQQWSPRSSKRTLEIRCTGVSGGCQEPQDGDEPFTLNLPAFNVVGILSTESAEPQAEPSGSSAAEPSDVTWRFAAPVGGRICLPGGLGGLRPLFEIINAIVAGGIACDPGTAASASLDVPPKVDSSEMRDFCSLWWRDYRHRSLGGGGIDPAAPSSEQPTSKRGYPASASSVFCCGQYAESVEFCLGAGAGRLEGALQPDEQRRLECYIRQIPLAVQAASLGFGGASADADMPDLEPALDLSGTASIKSTKSASDAGMLKLQQAMCHAFAAIWPCALVEIAVEFGNILSIEIDSCLRMPPLPTELPTSSPSEEASPTSRKRTTNVHSTATCRTSQTPKAPRRGGSREEWDKPALEIRAVGLGIYFDALQAPNDWRKNTRVFAQSLDVATPSLGSERDIFACGKTAARDYQGAAPMSPSSLTATPLLRGLSACAAPWTVDDFRELLSSPPIAVEFLTGCFSPDGNSGLAPWTQDCLQASAQGNVVLNACHNRISTVTPATQRSGEGRLPYLEDFTFVGPKWFHRLAEGLHAPAVLSNWMHLPPQPPRRVFFRFTLETGTGFRFWPHALVTLQTIQKQLALPGLSVQAPYLDANFPEASEFNVRVLTRAIEVHLEDNLESPQYIFAAFEGLSCALAPNALTSHGGGLVARQLLVFDDELLRRHHYSFSFDPNYDVIQSNATLSHMLSRMPCECGHVLLPEARFCSQCGKKRQMEHKDVTVTSPNPRDAYALELVLRGFLSRCSTITCEVRPVLGFADFLQLSVRTCMNNNGGSTLTTKLPLHRSTMLSVRCCGAKLHFDLSTQVVVVATALHEEMMATFTTAAVDADTAEQELQRGGNPQQTRTTGLVEASPSDRNGYTHETSHRNGIESSHEVKFSFNLDMLTVNLCDAISPVLRLRLGSDVHLTIKLNELNSQIISMAGAIRLCDVIGEFASQKEGIWEPFMESWTLGMDIKPGSDNVTHVFVSDTALAAADHPVDKDGQCLYEEMIPSPPKALNLNLTAQLLRSLDQFVRGCSAVHPTPKSPPSAAGVTRIPSDASGCGGSSVDNSAPDGARIAALNMSGKDVKAWFHHSWTLHGSRLKAVKAHWNDYINENDSVPKELRDYCKSVKEADVPEPAELPGLAATAQLIALDSFIAVPSSTTLALRMGPFEDREPSTPTCVRIMSSHDNLKRDPSLYDIEGSALEDTASFSSMFARFETKAAEEGTNLFSDRFTLAWPRRDEHPILPLQAGWCVVIHADSNEGRETGGRSSVATQATQGCVRNSVLSVSRPFAGVESMLPAADRDENVGPNWWKYNCVAQVLVPSPAHRLLLVGSPLRVFNYTGLHLYLGFQQLHEYCETPITFGTEDMAAATAPASLLGSEQPIDVRPLGLPAAPEKFYGEEQTTSTNSGTREASAEKSADWLLPPNSFCCVPLPEAVRQGVDDVGFRICCADSHTEEENWCEWIQPLRDMPGGEWLWCCCRDSQSRPHYFRLAALCNVLDKPFPVQVFSVVVLPAFTVVNVTPAMIAVNICQDDAHQLFAATRYAPGLKTKSEELQRQRSNEAIPVSLKSIHRHANIEHSGGSSTSLSGFSSDSASELTKPQSNVTSKLQSSLRLTSRGHGGSSTKNSVRGSTANVKSRASDHSKHVERHDKFRSACNAILHVNDSEGLICNVQPGSVVHMYHVNSKLSLRMRLRFPADSVADPLGLKEDSHWSTWIHDVCFACGGLAKNVEVPFDAPRNSPVVAVSCVDFIAGMSCPFWLTNQTSLPLQVGRHDRTFPLVRGVWLLDDSLNDIKLYLDECGVVDGAKISLDECSSAERTKVSVVVVPETSIAETSWECFAELEDSLDRQPASEHKQVVQVLNLAHTKTSSSTESRLPVQGVYWDSEKDALDALSVQKGFTPSTTAGHAKQSLPLIDDDNGAASPSGPATRATRTTALGGKKAHPHCKLPVPVTHAVTGSFSVIFPEERTYNFTVIRDDLPPFFGEIAAPTTRFNVIPTVMLSNRMTFRMHVRQAGMTDALMEVAAGESAPYWCRSSARDTSNILQIQPMRDFDDVPHGDGWSGNIACDGHTSGRYAMAVKSWTDSKNRNRVAFRIKNESPVKEQDYSHNQAPSSNGTGRLKVLSVEISDALEGVVSVCVSERPCFLVGCWAFNVLSITVFTDEPPEAAVDKGKKRFRSNFLQAGRQNEDGRGNIDNSVATGVLDAAAKVVDAGSRVGAAGAEMAMHAGAKVRDAGAGIANRMQGVAKRIADNADAVLNKVHLPSPGGILRRHGTDEELNQLPNEHATSVESNGFGGQDYRWGWPLEVGWHQPFGRNDEKGGEQSLDIVLHWQRLAVKSRAAPAPDYKRKGSWQDLGHASADSNCVKLKINRGRVTPLVVLRVVDLVDVFPSAHLKQEAVMVCIRPRLEAGAEELIREPARGLTQRPALLSAAERKRLESLRRHSQARLKAWIESSQGSPELLEITEVSTDKLQDLEVQCVCGCCGNLFNTARWFLPPQKPPATCPECGAQLTVEDCSNALLASTPTGRGRRLEPERASINQIESVQLCAVSTNDTFDADFWDHADSEVLETTGQTQRMAAFAFTLRISEIGLSVISERLRQEVFYGHISELELSVRQGRGHERGKFNVKDIRVDCQSRRSQLSGSPRPTCWDRIASKIREWLQQDTRVARQLLESPSIIASVGEPHNFVPRRIHATQVSQSGSALPRKKRDDDKRDLPCIDIQWDRPVINLGGNALCAKKLRLSSHKRWEVTLDQIAAAALLSLRSEIASAMDLDDIGDADSEKAQKAFDELLHSTRHCFEHGFEPPATLPLVQAEKVDISGLEIGVWGAVELSQLPTSMMPPSLAFFLRFMVLSNSLCVEGSTLFCKEWNVTDDLGPLRMSPGQVNTLVSYKYKVPVLVFVAKAFGCSNLLAVPKMIFNAPLELMSGVMQGVAMGLDVLDFSKLTMDQQYIEARREHKAKDDLVDSLEEGFQVAGSLLIGGFFGISDVLVKPKEKWEEKGLLGIPEGLCRGLVSALVKLIDGIIRAVRVLAKGLAAGLGGRLLRKRKVEETRLTKPKASDAEVESSPEPSVFDGNSSVGVAQAEDQKPLSREISANAAPNATKATSRGPALRGEVGLRLPRLLFGESAALVPFQKWHAQVLHAIGPELSQGIYAVWHLSGGESELVYLVLCASHAGLRLLDLNRGDKRERKRGIQRSMARADSRFEQESMQILELMQRNIEKLQRQRDAAMKRRRHRPTVRQSISRQVTEKWQRGRLLRSLDGGLTKAVEKARGTFHNDYVRCACLCSRRATSRQTAREAYHKKKVLATWAWNELRHVEVLIPYSGSEGMHSGSMRDSDVTAIPSKRGEWSDDSMMARRSSLSERKLLRTVVRLQVETATNGEMTEWPLFCTARNAEFLQSVCQDVNKAIDEIQISYE